MNEGEIRALLAPALNHQVTALQLFDKIDSTNAWLLEQPAPEIDRWHIAIADRQTRGRGRSGRQWHSPASGGLWMSGAYTFETLPENLSALTLAIGVGVANVLRNYGLASLRIKWPNDLLAGNKKLGGILLDTTQAGSSNLTVVCGLGINVDLGKTTALPAEVARNGDLLATDLKHCLDDVPAMPQLAAAMIAALGTTTQRYVAEGFCSFADEFQQLDWLRGRRVRVEQQEVQEGIAAGIAANGALILRVGEKEVHVVSGSVRPCDPADALA